MTPESEPQSDNPLRAREVALQTGEDGQPESDTIRQVAELTPTQRRFLESYATLGTISHAAEKSGIHRDTHYEWMKCDTYRLAFEAAHDDACDALEQEARRRASEGWQEPVFYEGEVCGHKQRYSDALLMFLLKGNRPDKYRDNVSIEQVNGPLPVLRDKNWYGNSAHEIAAQSAGTASASTADS